MPSALRVSCLALVAFLFVPAVASAQLGGPDGFGHVYDTGVYDFVDITATGVSTSMTDDGEEEVLLPFTFNFYGVDYDWVTIGGNGALTFSDGSGEPPIYAGNDSFPDTSTGSPDVALFWDDLDAAPQGEAYYLDDSANDRFIVSWVDIARWSDIGMASFQIHLNDDGTIEFHYSDVDFGDDRYDFGASATVGIQDFTGGNADLGWALELGYNTPFLADGDSYLIWNADADGDFYAPIANGGTDCDDTDPTINPDALDICDDSIDQDCSGADSLQDGDADTFINVDCGGDDCDDGDAAVFPGAVEVCDDGIDNDCDAATLDLFDDDIDGFTCDDDCDDADANSFPGALEICGDGVDQDCNGWDQLVDMDLDGDWGPACGGLDCDDSDPTISTLIDGDGDGEDACTDCDDADPANFWGNVEICDGQDNDCDGVGDDQADLDGDGVDACSGDCDDDDAANFPGNVEICDEQDNDCDGVIDDVDGDGDGFTCDVDCDDADATIFPGAAEVCDTIDNDCDGLDDEFDLDVNAVVGEDLTGTSAPALAIDSGPHDDIIAITGATAPVLAVTVTVDITHPWTGDMEISLISPDGNVVLLSDNRGGSGDDMTATVFDDAASDPISGVASWDAPFTGSWIPDEPLATFVGETADGDWTLSITDTWTGGDDGVLNEWTLDITTGSIDDADGDGAVDGCGDCDPADATVFPGAPEVCGDGIDQDCDTVDLLADEDGDTFIDILCGGDDCDDTDATAFPGATEICDTVDNDCDGVEDVFDLDIGAVTTLSTGTSAPALYFDNLAPGADTIDFATGITDGIVDVNVTVDVSHTWASDVTLTLTSPAGTVVTLVSGEGGGSDDFTDTVFDDQAATSITAGSPPFTGTFQPEGSLADFLGEAIDGTWTLDLTDCCGGDNGTLNDWTLDISTGSVDDADGDGAVDSCGDCDPADGDVFPGAAEICGDGIDNDCLDGDLVVDVDADTFSDMACGGTDCNDADAAINPSAMEVCGDDLDSDCTGLNDDYDGDGDMFPGIDCGGPDCDDANIAIFPGAPELCDTIDSDCDGLDDVFDVNIGATTTPGFVTPGIWFERFTDAVSDMEFATGITDTISDVNVMVTITHTWDDDVNVYLTSPAGTEVELFTDIGGSGDHFLYTVLDDQALLAISDFDTSSAAPFTGAFQPEGTLADFNGETLDGTWTLRVEDDFSGDSGVLLAWGMQVITGAIDDADGDWAVDSCGDCNPGDATIFPGALEVCGDTIDQDCDGADDVEDFDADSFVNGDCGGDDCDDADATVFPGAMEVCADTIDNDCDATTEDIFDGDADGSLCDVDCDDADALVFPGFFEICNDGIDNDCDAATADLGDADGDLSPCDVDCDDTNPDAYPGATEILCSGVEEDCDATVAPDIDDGDGDTFTCDLDCDDTNPATNPGALEIPCDGIDNDCDGEVDTDDGADNDMDLDGATCDVDCDDNDPNRFPGNVEVCDDAIDNDCDPSTDDVHDFDLDGSDCVNDCDDTDPLSFPGAPEICGDGIDQDCDAVADELVADVYDLDDDDSLLIGICSFTFPFCGGDWDTLYVQDNGRLTFGFDDQTSAESVAGLLADTPQIAPLWTDLDPSSAGTVTVTEDDGVSLTIDFTGVPQFGLPGTANNFELILWVDGMATIAYGDIDETDGLVGFACGDTDVVAVDFSELNDDIIGQGTEDAVYEQFSDLGSPNDLANEQLDLCLTSGVDDDGDGWTDACGDCDDLDANAFPGNLEICGDGVDNDCDGAADNADADEDGFIDEACGGTDCDDADPDISPDATEICNEIDDDCDGVIEDDELDGDGDGETPCQGDCDDTDEFINTFAEEVCDLVDNNCDTVVDEGFESDLDDDGYISEECGGDDCDDTRAGAFPGGDEVCDGGDNDCDGTIDNVDQDADTFIDEACGGDDCNDADAAVNPDAEEIPYDGINNDCGEDGDLLDVDGDGEPGVDGGGTDCNDNDAAINTSTAEVCDDEIDNDCDELTDKDDEECGACADCNSSLGGAGAQGGLFALLLVALATLRRRRL